MEKNINACDDRGETLLMKAAREGNLARVKDLIERGANPKIKNNRGEDALDIAITAQDFDRLRGNEADPASCWQYGPNQFDQVVRYLKKVKRKSNFLFNLFFGRSNERD